MKAWVVALTLFSATSAGPALQPLSPPRALFPARALDRGLTRIDVSGTCTMQARGAATCILREAQPAGLGGFSAESIVSSLRFPERDELGVPTEGLRFSVRLVLRPDATDLQIDAAEWISPVERLSGTPQYYLVQGIAPKGAKWGPKASLAISDLDEAAVIDLGRIRRSGQVYELPLIFLRKQDPGQPNAPVLIHHYARVDCSGHFDSRAPAYESATGPIALSADLDWRPRLSQASLDILVERTCGAEGRSDHLLEVNGRSGLLNLLRPRP